MSAYTPGGNRIKMGAGVVQPGQRERILPMALFLAVGSFCLAFFCKNFLSLSGGIAAVWLADALAIAFLYRYSVRHWPLLLTAAFAGNFVAAISVGFEWGIAAMYSLAGAAEALTAACLLRTFCADGDFFGSMWRWLRFIFFGALLSTLAGAGVGASVAALFRGAPFTDVFLYWYLADAIGICIFLPLIYLINSEAAVRIFSFRSIVHLVLVWLTSLVCVVAVLAIFPYPFVFITLPLIWAASRLELPQALLVIFSATVSLVMILTKGVAWLPDTLPVIQTPLDFLPLYAGIVPAYVMAVASSIERKRSQRIMEVESSFRAAMESSRIGMLLVSLDNRIIQANASFCRFIGYTEVVLKGLSIREVVLSDAPGAGDGKAGGGRQPLIDFEVGFVQDAEWRFVRKNGELVWGHWSCSLARGAHNEPLYAVVQVEDIDWRKRSEAQLARAEERWKFSLTVTGQVVYDWDLISGKTFYSEWLSSGIGIDSSRLASRQDWLARVDREDRERLLQAQLSHFAGAVRDIDCQYRVRTDSGALRWIHEVARVMESSDDGQPLRLIGVLRDITDNKNMARSLAEEKEHLQVTLTAIADAVIATDRLRRITFMNPVAEQLTGWRLEEVKGREVGLVFQISSGRQGAPVTGPVEECLAHNLPVFSADGTVLHNRSGASYDVKCSASPLRTSNGQLLGPCSPFRM